VAGSGGGKGCKAASSPVAPSTASACGRGSVAPTVGSVPVPACACGDREPITTPAAAPGRASPLLLSRWVSSGRVGGGGCKCSIQIWPMRAHDTRVPDSQLTNMLCRVTDHKIDKYLVPKASSRLQALVLSLPALPFMYTTVDHPRPTTRGVWHCLLCYVCVCEAGGRVACTHCRVPVGQGSDARKQKVSHTTKGKPPLRVQRAAQGHDMGHPRGLHEA
jgi:hypothetical protein